MARGTSMRKISSKLAAHFEPLNFVKVRLIQKNKESSGFQIGDALIVGSSPLWRQSANDTREALRFISIFRESGFRDSPDPELWSFLENTFRAPPEKDMTAHKVQLLKVLGFDPRFASCGGCGSAAPMLFSFEDMCFYCAGCGGLGLRQYSRPAMEFLIPDLH